MTARSRAFAVAMAVLCVLLLLALAFGQVAHIHQTASEADHCALCIVLHSAAPVAAAAIILIVLVQSGSAAPFQEIRLAVRPWHPSLFTRPPPSRG